MASWFRPAATTLLRRAEGYLVILSAHSVAWQQITSPDPGRGVYEAESMWWRYPRAGASLRAVKSGP